MRKENTWKQVWRAQPSCHNLLNAASVRLAATNKDKSKHRARLVPQHIITPQHKCLLPQLRQLKVQWTHIVRGNPWHQTLPYSKCASQSSAAKKNRSSGVFVICSSFLGVCGHLEWKPRWHNFKNVSTLSPKGTILLLHELQKSLSKLTITFRVCCANKAMNGMRPRPYG